MKKFFALILMIGFVSATIVAQTREMTPSQKLRYAEQIIENYYVDTVNSDKLVEEAIVAMLKTLDPHSTYTNPEETTELTTPLNGNFSGIGIQFNMNNDTLYVVQTTAGGPSEKVGIVAGDRIISANDTLISGVKMKNSDIIKILRGPKGSKVNVKVLRKGEKNLIDFRITRDDIPVYSVTASYMADPTTGYIKISRFAEDTHNELMQAMEELKRQGMKNVIIDLESNSGGYLSAAYNMASEFLNYGDLVVYTDGPRIDSQRYYAEAEGSYVNGRVVVLVNQYSASASEIFAGAMQDNDRGLVVGRRTFGKGLVQRPFPFPDGSMIRLTISRYYTPAGRCIQKPYTEGESDDYRKDMSQRYDSGELMSADSIHFADSLKCYTRNGRVVYGGGGIMPDLFVPMDTADYSDYYRDLVAKGVINQYCLNYVDANRKALKRKYKTTDRYIAEFEVTPEIMQGLIDKATAEGVEFNEEQYNISRNLLMVIVKGLIANDLYDEKGIYNRIVNEINPIYKAALQLINDEAEYNRLLSGSNQPSSGATQAETTPVETTPDDEPDPEQMDMF
ncbi:MAG: S41 family peptidase [Muribaculaceae bacterium]|nr:S41 family peptidase [Muribaculaceae bacterium]